MRGIEFAVCRLITLKREGIARYRIDDGINLLLINEIKVNVLTRC